MQRLVSILVCTFLFFCVKAQEPEYMFEIGAGLGSSWSYNDVNRTKLISQPTFASSLLFRYNANPRWALVAEVASMGVKGDSRKHDNAFFDGSQKTFDNRLWQVAFRPEFHFQNYGWTNDYREKKRIVPFLTAGIGYGYSTGDGHTGSTFDMPFGLGAKWKLSQRLNAQLTCLFTRTFGDVVDGIKDPYNMNSSCISNSDWVGSLVLSLTFDFKERCVQCLNKDY